jgi:hypothetical protein
MKKLIPKCFNGTLQAAITNRGYLIPCCYCDTKTNLDSPEMKKLEKVSKIDTVDSIEEILLSDEWQEFAYNLENDKGPPACWHVCGSVKNETKRHTTFYKNRKPHIEEV